MKLYRIHNHGGIKMTWENEQSFIDSLLKDKKVPNRTIESIREENEQFKKKIHETAIRVPEQYIVRTQPELTSFASVKEDEVISEQPPDEPDVNVPEPGEEEPDMDEPEELPEPSDIENTPVKENGVTKSIEALFLTNIIVPGDNFKEFKSERMKQSLVQQGMPEEVYNQIGKAFYNLDTQSDLLK
jgi:hypothetical protein